MAIEKWSDQIWLVKLADEPMMSEDLNSVYADVQHTDPAATPDVVLDLGAVGMVNSSNLSQMLRLRKLMIDRDGRLRIAALRDDLWALFLTTGLDKVFEFSQDVPTALASLQIEQ